MEVKDAKDCLSDSLSTTEAEYDAPSEMVIKVLLLLYLCNLPKKLEHWISLWFQTHQFTWITLRVSSGLWG